MNTKKTLKISAIFLVATLFTLLSITFISAQIFDESPRSNYNNLNNQNYPQNTRTYGSSFNPQLYPPGYSGFSFNDPSRYWSDYGSDRCIAGQDLILQIAPGGCSPAVVRSDLLEEQNVPVFCKVMAVKVNPLIDISRIRSIRVKGQYPKGVSSVSYYPAKAAIGGQKVFDNPVFENNLGYLVIVLSRQPVESNMSDYVQGNITAIVDYLSEGIYGVGDTSFYLSEMNNEEWYRDYKDYGFWNGRGYIRVDSIDQNTATISVYRDANSKQSSVTLREGQTSRDLFLSGYYCAAGMNIRVDRISYPVDSALLQINDEQVWVAKGDRIINAANRGYSYGTSASRRYSSYGSCRVIDLQASEGGGTVKIKCPGNDLIELSLNPGKVIFEINERKKEAIIGDEIIENVFLGYVNQNKEGTRYAVLVKDKYSTTRNEFIYKEVTKVIKDSINKETNLNELKKRIEKKVKEHYEKKLKFDKKEIESNIEVEILIEEGKSEWEIKLNRAIIAQNRIFDSEELNDRQILGKEYYDQTIPKYETLADLYPSEKRAYIQEDEYAARGLLDAARLSRTFGMDENSHIFYERLVNEYPNSNSAREAEIMNKYLMSHDTSNSRASVRMNNEHFFIDLLTFKKTDEKEASAVVLIDGKEETWGLNKINTIKKENLTHSFKITDIKDEYIDLQYEKSGGEKDSEKKKRLTIQNNQDIFGGINIKLLKINLKKQVKLSVFSRGQGPRTESKFNFKIGIEKRAIQISPEKAKEMLESLEKSITSWNEINEKLGNVIRGLKGACFATSTILTIKNLMNGASGKSLSRGIIMTNSGGWNDKCEELVNKGQYTTIHQCILDKESEIEKDINIHSGKIQETNNIIKRIQNKNKIKNDNIFDFTERVDTQKVEEEFKEEFKTWCTEQDGSITLPDKQDSKVNLGSSEDSVCNWDTLTHEQRRDIMTLYKVKNSGGSKVLKDLTNRELGTNLLNAKNYHDEFEERKKADKDAKTHNLGLRTTDPVGDSITYGFIKTISATDRDHNIYKNLEKGKSVIRVHIPNEKNLGKGIKFTLGDGLDETEKKQVQNEIGGKQVIVQVKLEANNNYYTPDKTQPIFLIDGTEITNQKSKKAIWDYMEIAGLGKIKKSDKTAYQNKMKHPERLTVKYFEKAPYKGLPAEVPFDIENGWYVEMTYVLSGFGKPYDESGRVINFYICNVGENGLIEFKKSADDICRYYNVHTGADIGFPGMTQSESMNLVRKAQNAIQQAAKQYGKEKVSINGNNFKTGTSFGGGEGKCTDFMSAKDCTLMFNVCDPVICPASRCDYGGKYRVDDVIQSGVIGSLLLCLPNYKEGVMVPICLSGVHAGLQGYISILNSTAECLKESIETGRNIGICDEIKSIYICDFFWKQAGPLMNLALPRMFENLLGQGVRGGGEYTTVKTAWENMKNSMTYFTNTYATNSMKAFSMRSTQYAGVDAGAEICKSFISTNLGGSVDFIKALVEPDSPVQYHAWFSENPMSTATVPPTSHYKVYFHIYSGKDWGAQYAVYLRDLEGSRQVFSTQYRFVDRGYVQRGSQVDRAIDFIGPSGYKQLCISVNGKEECGFGKVSTSYALNTLTDQYAEEQIQENIVTEKECVSGTPSFKSIYNPNIQSGIESIANSQLYNQGIIRICSTENPGKQVLPDGTYDRTNSTYDRWKSVGYCDDPALKCWIDTNSVKDVIKDKEIEKKSLEKVDLKHIEKNNYLTYEESKNIIERAQKFVNGFNIIGEKTKPEIESRIKYITKDLERVSELGTTNTYRARAHYLLSLLYKKISEGLWEWNEEMDESIIYIDDYEEIDSKVDSGSEEDEIVSDDKISPEYTLDDEDEIRKRVSNYKSFDFVSKDRGAFTFDEARFYYDADKVDEEKSGWFGVYSDLISEYNSPVEEIAAGSKMFVSKEIEKAAKIIINEAYQTRRKAGRIESTRFKIRGSRNNIYDKGINTNFNLVPMEEDDKFYIYSKGESIFESIGTIISGEISFGGKNFNELEEESKRIAIDLAGCCTYDSENKKFYQKAPENELKKTDKYNEISEEDNCKIKIYKGNEQLDSNQGVILTTHEPIKINFIECSRGIAMINFIRASDNTESNEKDIQINSNDFEHKIKFKDNNGVFERALGKFTIQVDLDKKKIRNSFNLISGDSEDVIVNR